MERIIFVSKFHSSQSFMHSLEIILANAELYKPYVTEDGRLK